MRATAPGGGRPSIGFEYRVNYVYRGTGEDTNPATKPTPGRPRVQKRKPKGDANRCPGCRYIIPSKGHELECGEEQAA